MRMNDAFPSNFLKAIDVEEQDMTLTIKSVETEEVGPDKEEKPVMKFRGFDKGFILNKTNWGTIAKNFGTDETDDWIGKQITLFSDQTTMGGETKMCIRVRLKKAATGQPKRSTPAPADQDGYADENAGSDELKSSAGF